ncbi:MAG: hypothetical protein HZC43_05665 [Nitrosomonadales bacterium]|nr:hypothetical protein [Nitrosomonadales bacterium]
MQPAHEWEILGINSKAQLAALERTWQREQAQRLLEQGVTLADPALTLADPARLSKGSRLEFPNQNCRKRVL